MKNIEVVRGFLRGSNCKTRNLTSKDGQLINYSTTIARLENGVCISGQYQVFTNYFHYSKQG